MQYITSKFSIFLKADATMSRISDSSSPTIQDIAQKVGVSKGAVSVVLNGSNSSTRVSEGTRQRILAVAQALNYRPNVAAQALTRGRMDTIGVMFGLTSEDVPIMSRALAMDILQGASIAAERHDKNLMIFTRAGRGPQGEERRLSDQRTDGIVVAMPVTEGDMIRRLLEQPQPLVFIGYPADALGVPSVDIDHAAGAALATEHLLSLGHRRIAHIQGDAFFDCTGQRLSGFTQTMLSAGVLTPPEYLVQGSYDGTTAEENVRFLLSLPNPPTAIFAGNDLIAIKAIRRAKEMGFAVPERLSIVGFDDLSFSPMSETRLTTIRQPFYTLGEMAAELLLKRLNGEDVPAKTHIVPHELITRRTTAPPCS